MSRCGQCDIVSLGSLADPPVFTNQVLDIRKFADPHTATSTEHNVRRYYPDLDLWLFVKPLLGVDMVRWTLAP